jgi:LacI family transcriptional regulator
VEGARKARAAGFRGQVFLSPFEMTGLPRQMLAEVDVLRGLLASQGQDLVVRGCPAFSTKRPASALARLAEIYPEHGWILYRASAEVQDWFARSRLPVLLRGSPHAGIDLPFMDIDWKAVGRHAAGRMGKKGVGRVLFLTTGSHLQGLRLAEEGFCEGLTEDMEFIRFSDNGRPEEVGRAMEKHVLRAEVPVLLVCTRARQVVTGQSWLAKMAPRLRYAPQFVCLDYDPLLEHMLPPVGHYRLDPEATARRVVRLAMSGGGGTRKREGVWLFPDYQE